MALALLATSALSPVAQAKARFMGLGEAVASSEVIALVRITASAAIPHKSEDELPRKGYFRYAQRNEFQVVEFVKRAPWVPNTLPGTQTLWGGKAFICASEAYGSGVYLVFLESVGAGEWIGVNHDMGALPVIDARIDWPYGRDFSRRKISFDQAKGEIKKASLNSSDTLVEAFVDPAIFPMHNHLVSGRSHQRLVFHLRGKRPSPWPAETELFVSGYISKAVLTEERYLALIKEGGNVELTVVWRTGSLEILSVRRVGRA